MVRILVALGVILTISACSGGSAQNSASSWNPFNWFGGNKDTQNTLAPRGGYQVEVDRRPLVQTITNVSADKTAYGIILRATASTPTLGSYDADLVEVPDSGSGILVYEFHAWPPRNATSAGTAIQREVVAVTFLSAQEIRGIRLIRIIGATNSLTVRP